MSTETVTLSPAIVANLESAWTDKASVIKSRGIRTFEAVEAAGSVKAMIDALKAAGARSIKSAPVYGVVLGAAAMVTLAGYPVNASQVSAEAWRTLAGHVERAGKGPTVAAAKAAVSPLLDTVTPAERLELILSALDNVGDRRTRDGATRGAGKAASEKGKDADTETPLTITPVTVTDADKAGEAARQSLAHALTLLASGGTVTDQTRALLAKLAGYATVTAPVPVAA